MLPVLVRDTFQRREVSATVVGLVAAPAVAFGALIAGIAPAHDLVGHEVFGIGLGLTA